MNIILYLATKYLKFKSSDRGLSTIGIIAFLTVVFSCMAAVVIMSAANGFHYNFKQKLMSRDAHITILGPGQGISNYEVYIDAITNIPGVVRAIPYFDQQALLKGPLGVWGSFIKAIPADYYEKDEEFQQQFIVEQGNFDLYNSRGIVLGNNLARTLGVTVGSSIKVLVYGGDFFNSYPFKVTGIFTAGYAEYDSSLAFISFRSAQMMLNSPNYAYGIAVKVKDPFEAEKYLAPISEVCPYSKWTWKSMNRNNLVALDNEKLLMQIILFFFFLVVFFNILSTMIAMVLDKKEEIGIQKAMGLKPSDVLYVFLFDGFLLGAIGSLLGILMGLLITLTLNNILHGIEKIIDFINRIGFEIASLFQPLPEPTPFRFFKSSVYYISEFPIQILFGDLVFVATLAILISTLAVIFPAWKASQLRPVEVLRND